MQPSLLLARISRRTQCLQRSSFQRPRYFSSAIASCHDGPSTSSSDGFPAPDGPPAQLLDNNTEPPSHLEPPLIEHPPSDNGESGNTVRYLVPRPEVQWNRRTGKRIDEKRQGQGKGSIAGVPVKFIRGDEPYERSSPGRGEYWVPKTYDSEDFLSHETQLVGQWKLEGTNAAETFGFTRPWQRYGGEYGCRDFTIRSLQRLEAELKSFDAYVTPTRSEMRAMELCKQEIITVIEENFPANPVVQHGSRSTALAGPLSDIDLMITMPETIKGATERGPSPGRPAVKQRVHEILYKIRDKVKKSDRYTDINLAYGHASILSLLEKSTGLTIQIGAGAPAIPAREFTSYYLSEFPALRAIYSTIRQALVMRGMAFSPTGGIGSYPLLIMIVTALKHSPTPFAAESLGEQFLYVLQFWAEADLNTWGYAADPPRKFTKAAQSTASVEKDADGESDPYVQGIKILADTNWKKAQAVSKDRWCRYGPGSLCLQDPANPINDLGKRAILIGEVQRFFANVYISTRSRMQKWDVETETQRRANALLSPVLRGNYSKYVSSRYQLREADPKFIKRINLRDT